MSDLASAYGDRMRAVMEDLIAFESTAGNETPAQEYIEGLLTDLGFETYRWTADADALADHPSFEPAADLALEDRPSVAGVFEFGDPDAGRTLVLNGHVDVVPAGETGDRELDGRLVVESVAGEEDGGLGAASAALSNPYPFERDAAVVAEPTDLQVVTATEGCLMARIGIEGTQAHAARRWEGESVLPAFERVRAAFEALERERAESVSHPLYDRFDVPWPIVIGRVSAGTWASNVPGTLTAELRAGVAPGESLDAVERACRETLEAVAADPAWTVDPPTFERFGVQFASAETDPGEPVVRALQEAMTASGLSGTAPVGETYGSDARHYIEAGIPTAVFGPGRIEGAHFPDESIHWPDVLAAGEVFAETARRYLK